MKNLEKELPDFITDKNVTRHSVTEGIDFFESARDYVKIIKGNPCGNWGANSLYLKNNNPERKIGVTIEVRWVYENRPRTESRIYNLFPGQQIELGCPIPGPTNQRFDYILISAWFV